MLLIRHGSVDAPEPGGLIGGRSDPPLNPTGVEQAAALAERLAGERLSAVYATPLRRSQQTAAPLAERAGVEVVVEPDLNEIFLGDWEGHEINRRGATGDPEFLAMVAGGRWDVIPNAEAQDAFAARVDAGLERIASLARDGEAIVAVTHGAVVAEALRKVTGSDPFAFLNCQNGSISRIVRTADGRWMLVSFNDTSHLRVIGS